MIRYKFYYPGNEYTNLHMAPDGEWVRYYDIVNTWRDWVDKHGRLSLIIRDLGSQVNKLQIEVSELEEACRAVCSDICELDKTVCDAGFHHQCPIYRIVKGHDRISNI